MREELFIHQYNFSNWMPSAVRSIAVDKSSGIVAVGRQDGEIELIGPNSKWHTQARISGKSDFDLSGLVFSNCDEESGRLFGSTLQGYIFEVDHSSATLKNIRDSYGGTVWALAVSKRGPMLALGCEDGTVKLFSFANSQLDYQKSMSATGSRILSVAFHPVEMRVYAGCSDGTIRCYNETTGSNLFRIVGDVQKGVMCSIWSLLVLKDSTLVSGDNHGKVQFWNGYSGNELLSTFHQHSSTILCLAASEKEDAIFASGEDSRVICLRRLNSTRDFTPSSVFPSSSDPKRLPILESMLNCQWVYTSSHRPHSHDVRSLAIATQSGSNSQNKSILISGGVDCKLCMYSVDDFTGSRPTWILPIPARGVTSASADSTLLTVKHRTHLDIWSLNRPTLKDGHTRLPPPSDQSAIGSSLSCRIQLKDGVSRDYFHSIALTNDGQLLAATGGGAHESESLDSLSGLRLWHLTRPRSGSKDPQEIVAVKVQLPTDILELFNDDVTCQSLAFSSDGGSLCVAVCGADSVKLVLLDVKKPPASEEDEEEDGNTHVSIRHVIHHTRQVRARRQTNLSRVPAASRSSATPAAAAAAAGVPAAASTAEGLTEKLSCGVSSLSYSADGRWLGVCSSDKLVFIYEIDRLSLHWELPAFDSPISCLAFHPQSPNSLVVVLAGDNSFQIFDVQDKALSPWSLENKDLVPSWVSSLGRAAAAGAVTNISFDPTCVSAFVMHGQAFSVYVNLDRPIPCPDAQMRGSTHAMLSAAATELPTKLEMIQKELADLVPTDRKFVKKRKKLQKELEAEEHKLTAAPPPSEAANKIVKKSRKNGSVAEGKNGSVAEGKNGSVAGEEEEKNGHSSASVAQAAVTEMRNFSILKSHRSIVYLSILNSNEMVVVENPWVRILESLPETLARKRYGA